ncbi:dna repair protein rad1 [Epithele typhae]|uniref:dna repair protein rad1 n=1 Tax=Epithele typhae TaxID=378194 RepID=UPI00200782E5|nr:dna repair protein rad1 [Epithele typhae]KAH9910403.1 dna repair protein rad1 [Epithele typhae]
MPIHMERGSVVNDTSIRTISIRMTGGRKEVSTEPAPVIADMGEFRSSLSSLLHASGFPMTFTVGDFILTPDICVECTSIPDLVSSLNSGRLYTQYELMSAYYKQPILLIEFKEHQSFALEAVANANLVLLTLTFPRGGVLWPSSPYATAEVFNDLKDNMVQRDPVLIDAEEDAGANTTAEELLCSPPGVAAKNVKHILSRVGSVRKLCGLPMKDLSCNPLIADLPRTAAINRFRHWASSISRS